MKEENKMELYSVTLSQNWNALIPSLQTYFVLLFYELNVIDISSKKEDCVIFTGQLFNIGNWQ